MMMKVYKAAAATALLSFLCLWSVNKTVNYHHDKVSLVFCDGNLVASQTCNYSLESKCRPGPSLKVFAHFLWITRAVVVAAQYSFGPLSPVKTTLETDGAATAVKDITKTWANEQVRSLCCNGRFSRRNCGSNDASGWHLIAFTG